ncbi:MAG: heme-copper oxidase subunit III [Salinigranum sp.]
MGTEEAHEEHVHHLPAVEDWPRGFGEASWWPFITALGAVGIYVGVALYIMGHGGNQIVGPMTGPVVFIAGVAVFLTGLYGWLYHAFVSHFWSREATHEGESKLRWGMVAFLGSEVATFGGLFTYYFFIRSGAWPPAGLPDVLSSLVLANTAILIASSFTLHWAHLAIRRDNHRNFVLGLGVTLLLGLVFLGGQAYEYYEFIVHSNFTWTTGIFGSAFFGLTGLHGLHVSMGAVLLSILFVRGIAGQYSADRHTSVATVSMYWHFVDAVWIFLVVVLYVGSTIGA